MTLHYQPIKWVLWQVREREFDLFEESIFHPLHQFILLKYTETGCLVKLCFILMGFRNSHETMIHQGVVQYDKPFQLFHAITHSKKQTGQTQWGAIWKRLGEWMFRGQSSAPGPLLLPKFLTRFCIRQAECPGNPARNMAAIHGNARNWQMQGKGVLADRCWSHS